MRTMIGSGLLLFAAALGSAGKTSGQVPPVPPPAEQLTADCRNPVFATDQLVCGDPVLRDLDSQLAEAVRGKVEPISPWFEPQRQWFLRRSRCAFSVSHAACTEAAYRERLELYEPHKPETQRRAARCDDPKIAAVVQKQGHTLLLDQQGNVLGSASSSEGKSDWKPFLVASRRTRNLIIRSAQDATLTCRTGNILPDFFK